MCILQVLCTLYLYCQWRTLMLCSCIPYPCTYFLKHVCFCFFSIKVVWDVLFDDPNGIFRIRISTIALTTFYTSVLNLTLYLQKQCTLVLHKTVVTSTREHLLRLSSNEQKRIKKPFTNCGQSIKRSQQILNVTRWRLGPRFTVGFIQSSVEVLVMMMSIKHTHMQEWSNCASLSFHSVSPKTCIQYSPGAVDKLEVLKQCLRKRAKTTTELPNMNGGWSIPSPPKKAAVKIPEHGWQNLDGLSFGKWSYRKTDRKRTVEPSSESTEDKSQAKT